MNLFELFTDFLPFFLLVEMLEQGDINLDAEYQRGESIASRVSLVLNLPFARHRVACNQTSRCVAVSFSGNVC